MNQGPPQGGVKSPAYYFLFAEDIDWFCITESAISSFVEDTNVLCAGFMCQIPGQPTDNAQIEIH